MHHSALKKCLSFAAVLAGLLAFDRAIVPKDIKHSELAGLRAQARSLMGKPEAEVLVLGSSTIGQWLTPGELGSILELASDKVLDGHLSACYASCSFSVAEKLKAQGRHFRLAFAGVNLFSMCEGGAALRVMQNAELTPALKLPKLLSLYWHSPNAATYWGTWAAMSVSHAYRDVSYQQDRLSIWAFGKRSTPELWRFQENATDDPESLPGESQPSESQPSESQPSESLPTQPPQPGESQPAKPERDPGFARCDYSDEKIELQTRSLEAELATLSKLSDRVFLLSLPQRSLADTKEDATLAARWDKHRTALANIASRYSKVTLLDLTASKIGKRRYFRDAIHLNAAGTTLQSKNLRKLLQEHLAVNDE